MKLKLKTNNFDFYKPGREAYVGVLTKSFPRLNETEFHFLCFCFSSVGGLLFWLTFHPIIFVMLSKKQVNRLHSFEKLLLIPSLMTRWFLPCVFAQ